MLDLWELGKSERRVTVCFGEASREVRLRSVGDRTPAIEAAAEAAQAKMAEYADPERRERLRRALAALPTSELARLAAEGERDAMEAALERERPDPPLRQQPGETEAAFATRRGRWEAAAKERAAERESRLDARLAERAAELAAGPAEVLLDRACAIRLRELSLQVAIPRLNQMLLYLATFRVEEEERYFASPEQVAALHPAVRDQLLLVYRQLEEEDLPKG